MIDSGTEHPFWEQVIVEFGLEQLICFLKDKAGCSCSYSQVQVSVLNEDKEGWNDLQLACPRLVSEGRLTNKHRASPGSVLVAVSWTDLWPDQWAFLMFSRIIQMKVPSTCVRNTLEEQDREK